MLCTGHHYNYWVVERACVESTGALRARADEVDEKSGDLGGLLLLHPVSRAINEMRAFVFRTKRRHAFDRSGVLVNAPVTLAAHEHRGHINRSAGERLRVVVSGTRAIPVQAALESRPPELAAVHLQ